MAMFKAASQQARWVSVSSSMPSSSSSLHQSARTRAAEAGARRESHTRLPFQEVCGNCRSE
eukprot:14380200-Alexandrium_andersonii.AAC.1